MKKLYALFLTTLLVSSVYAQVINVHEQDGTDEMFDISTIRSISFNSHFLQLFQRKDYPVKIDYHLIKAINFHNSTKSPTVYFPTIVSTNEQRAIEQEATPKPAPVGRLHKNYAILIAIENYADPSIPSLTHPIHDAKLLKQVLTKNYDFYDEDIEIVENPKHEEIDVLFSKLIKKVTPHDNLIIFYAGHGYFDETINIGYWLPADANKNIRAKWYRNSAIVENINAINSKHTLLIADACFSGGIFKTRASIDNLNVSIADLMRKPSRRAITSGALNEVPDNSVFIKYLVKSLAENPKKYYPVEDLYNEIFLSVKHNSTVSPQYGIIHNTGDEGGNFVFVKRD